MEGFFLFVFKVEKRRLLVSYSAFQIDELHSHNQNLVGTLHVTSLLWSTDMKTAVNMLNNRYGKNYCCSKPGISSQRTFQMIHK